MENGNKAFLVFAGILGIGALVYALTRKNGQQPQSVGYTPTTWYRAGVSESQPIISNPEEPKLLYQNEERINLVRDYDGHISELVIHRRVTADG